MALPAQPRTEAANEDFRWLSPEEERVFFDAQVRAITGMSGEEFLRQLDAGTLQDLADDLDHADLMYLAMLSDIVR
ncbi:MAG TPA: hypothetical protein VFL91_18545 [Thermomicrobiales bacterium]|nr:hypothetical protein [Thermomicrobiales bacterium]